MEKLEQIIKDVKSLKIQGATNVAKAALKGLLPLSEEEIPAAIEQLLVTRPTEPLMQNCLSLVKLKGKSGIKPTLARLDEVKEEIIKNGLPLIKEGSNILTHCHSSTVVELLRQAGQKGINFKVYLTETRPAFQGRITAKELVVFGITTTMIVDSEAASLVSQEDEQEVNLVLFGADAILKDGSLINKVGSYGIALAAKKAKVPVYVLASLLKFSAAEVSIEERGGEEIWTDRPQNLKIFNPAFDKVPAELIIGLVTEKGIVKPSKIKSLVKKNYPWILQGEP